MTNLEKTQKQIKNLKQYYCFVGATILVTIMMVLMAFWFYKIGTPIFLSYIFLVSPLVFFVVLVFEYFRVFNKYPSLIKKWEEKKMQQFIENEKYKDKYVKSNNV